MHGIVKCLVVDDREDNIMVFTALLRREGVEVLTARSGAEALELLLVHEVALALLDVQMPEMDGFELADLMRGSERTRNVPIIFITAGAHHDHGTFKGYESGAVDFLYKPVDHQILRSKADVFFQLFRQKQQIAHELHERTQTLRLNEMFTAVLGHDLRNPLNAILGYAHVLQCSSKDEMVLDASNRMIASGRRMSRMIEDLVDLARARVGGGIRIQRSPTDLLPLIERIVQEQRAAFPGQKITVRKNGDLHGDWDPERLAQVASNLVANALQHGERGEPVQVDLDGTRTDQVMMTVANAGLIPLDVLPNLFDPFRSGQHRVDRSQGLGLGLYIVQQIVIAHEGTVDAESDGGRTLFRVRIPRRSKR